MLKPLSAADIAKLIGVHPETIRNWAANGQFPKPVRYNRRCFRWNAAVVQAWIEAKQADQQPTK